MIHLNIRCSIFQKQLTLVNSTNGTKNKETDCNFHRWRKTSACDIQDVCTDPPKYALSSQSNQSESNLKENIEAPTKTGSNYEIHKIIQSPNLGRIHRVFRAENDHVSEKIGYSMNFVRIPRGKHEVCIRPNIKSGIVVIFLL